MERDYSPERSAIRGGDYDSTISWVASRPRCDCWLATVWGHLQNMNISESTLEQWRAREQMVCADL